MMRVSRRAWAGAAGALLTLALSLTALPGADATPPPAPALQLVSTVNVGARMVDHTFSTPMLNTQTRARVLLPPNYDSSGATRYPVLLLLHGGAADYTSWTAQGGIAHILTQNLNLITVMPDAGRSAWYTDWYNNGLGGNPRWETYHLGQLLPWVDANYPTVGNRSGRAIAGLSSGGFGAMSYASRHPDLFVAAAAFSGAVDTNTPPVLAGKVIDGLALQDAGLPGSLFGLRETEEVRWRGHNPWDLATNLRDMSVTLRTGNGQAGGTYGGGGFADPGGYFLENACYMQSVSLHQRLDQLAIGHTWDDYGPGTHSFPYWNRSLERTLPTFMQVFSENRPDPAAFTYRAIEPSYFIFDWSVSLDRAAVEFSELAVTANGFAVSGSGDAAVVTGPVYTPLAAYDVTLTGAFGQQVVQVVADAAGRLAVDVPLGAANLAQQYFTPLHTSPATTVFTTTAVITPV
jgi:S-formylglutathione hydrolase FrmB